jgi:hypothetical protein
MIERIDGMPEGTVGFRASGEVTSTDYREVLEPALREAATSGEIRMLYVLDDDVTLDPGAFIEDARTGLGIGIGHHSAWRRSAVATDIEWVRRAMQLFAWMVPGDFRLFASGEIEAAQQWVSADVRQGP